LVLSNNLETIPIYILIPSTFHCYCRRNCWFD